MPLSKDPSFSGEKTKRSGSERMFQPEHLLLSAPHDSKEPYRCLSSFRIARRMRTLRKSSKRIAVLSDEMGFGKTGNTVMKSHPHLDTTQEKYHYQMGRLQITSQRTPAHWRKKPSSLRSGKLKVHSLWGDTLSR